MFYEHLQRVYHASRECLPFMTPGAVRFWTRYDPIVETSFPNPVVTIRISLGTFSTVFPNKLFEMNTSKHTKNILKVFENRIAEMSKSFWTCQSFGLILKILSVRTIKYAAEILIFGQSE